jgi:trimethylamine:corrinoid methyltransferase-like protein
MIHTPPLEKKSSLEPTIHTATLKVLQDTGVKIMNGDAVELFHCAGATVKATNGQNIVKIPASLPFEDLRPSGKPPDGGL